MDVELNSYFGYVLAIILTCVAILFILGMVLGMIAMTQDILERIPSITSSFREWRKSKIPDDFYHRSLDEAIELCENKGNNFNLSTDERASYRTLENWLTEYKYLRDKYEDQ